jgi:pilus assembly protein CpaB
MRLLKNRLFIGALCIIAALLFSFVALPALQGTGQGVYVNVIRLKDSVPAGAQITADMLETVKAPQNLVENGISDSSQAVGRYAKADLYAGDYLTIAKTSASPAGLNPFSAGVPKGKLVISVTLPSLASGVSGQLLPGDIVTVIVTPKGSSNKALGVEPESSDESPSDAVIYPDLQYLEVCTATAADGSDAHVKADPGKDEKNTLPVTISFYVNQQQALKLAEIEQEGIIHLAFVARGKAASQYLPDRVLAGTEAN